MEGAALSGATCWELVQTTSIGRLAVSVDALPLVVPIQFKVERGDLVACLGECAVPERAVNGTVVGLDVDSFDPGGGPGWWVHALARSSCSASDRFDPCQQHAALIRLQLIRIAGQQLSLCPPESSPRGDG